MNENARELFAQWRRLKEKDDDLGAEAFLDEHRDNPEFVSLATQAEIASRTLLAPQAE